MPGRPDCPDCPLKNSPTPCNVLASRHTRFCATTDRGGPEYRPGMRERVIALSGGTPEPPSLLRKAVNFAGAVVGHVAAGLPTLDDERTNARLAVCAPCEFRAAGSCNLCGCQLAVKARWAESVCPQGKWPL